MMTMDKSFGLTKIFVVATNDTGTIAFDVALPTSFNFSEQTSDVRNGGARIRQQPI